MKLMPIPLALVVYSLGFFSEAKAQTPQPMSESPLIIACKNLNAADVISNLENESPDLFNPLGVTLRAILDLHTRTEPSGPPPATPDIPKFPESENIEKILDALITHGANPLIHKLENIKLLNGLINAYQTTHFPVDQNPIIIALIKLLPMFLTYEVAFQIDPSTSKSAKVYGDIQLVTTYLESINNLYKYQKTKGFDPLNTPLIKNGEGFLGKTPVQLAAENGHAKCLRAMLVLKDNLGSARVSFITAYTALKNASDQKPGFIFKKKSCKEILEDFLHTRFSLNKEGNTCIIQKAQSTVAHKAWQQQRLEKDTYDNAITEAMSNYLKQRFIND